jgi:type IV pilus assembly protein PilC
MAFDLSKIKTQEKADKKPLFSSNVDSILKKEIHLFGSPFNNKVKEDLYTELSVLLKAGVQLKVAIDLVAESQKKKEVKSILEEISNEIVLGKNLSEIMKDQKVFTPYEYFSIRIGEETGTIDKVTKQLGEFFNQKNEQRRLITSALVYPVIILFTALLAVIFMLSYVVPMFESIFKQNQVELPTITRFIIACSELINEKGYLILFLIIILWFGRKLINKKQWYRSWKDRLLLRLPFIGKYIKTIYLAQFTQAMTFLTTSKVSMVNSIELVKKMLNFYPLQIALEEIEKDIIQGISLSKSISKHNVFGSKMFALIKVAEETNQTEFIFKRLHDQYSSELKQKSKTLTVTLEPVLIIVIGAIVGFILIAMYLPMFKLSSVLG